MPQLEVALTGIVDTATGNLIRLQRAGIAGSAGAIALGGISAVNTVAGVSPDGSKDIPVASLTTAVQNALNAFTAIAGLSGPTASKAQLNAALTTILSLAGQVPDAAGLITALQLRTALAGFESETWANLKTRTGNYDGELLRLPMMDVTNGFSGDWVYVYWSQTKARWRPLGRQCVAKANRATGSAGTSNIIVACPTLTLRGGPHWKETQLEVQTAVTASNNGCTSAPVNQSVGGTAWIGDTQATIRRKSFKRVLEIYDTGTNNQYAHAKADNFYVAESSDNSAGITFSLDTTNDFNVATDVGNGTSTGWANASSTTVSLQKLACYWSA